MEGSLWTKTTDLLKKTYFNGTHLLDRVTNEEKSDNIWLLGHKMANNAQAKLYYSSMLWFSYSDHLSFANSNLTSDVGWGCMLRVAQMMLAHTLRIHARAAHYDDFTFLTQLLDSFAKREGAYSIQKLVAEGERIYEKKAGQWYNPCQVAHIVKYIQNGLETDLRVVVSDCQLNLEETRRQLQPKLLSGKEKIVSGLIIVLVRIGVKEAEEGLLRNICVLLKSRLNCVGILGGRPGRAHYIFGSSERNFLYLDPHCVKDNSRLQSCLSEQMFSMAHEKVDPSMGLCFYVRDFVELLMLHDNLKSLQFLPFYLSGSDSQDYYDVGSQSIS